MEAEAMVESESFLDSLITLINEFDFAAFLPEIDSILGWIQLFGRICVMAAPLAVLFFGLWWLLLPPREANHSVGYRCYFGMGSVEAWRFTQKLAGILWTVLGVALTLIALLISNRFRDMETMAMLHKAITCILWEIGLTAFSCLLINLVVTLRYDAKGILRSEKAKKQP